MKNILAPMLLLFTFVAFADEINSTKASKPVPFRRIVKKESNHKGSAPILSVLIPGGGHFYLGNKKTGIAYVLTRALIIPGTILIFKNTKIFSDEPINKTELFIGETFATIGFASWITDIIHAAVSAKNYKPDVQETNKLSYGFISDFDEKKYGVAFNYTFK